MKNYIALLDPSLFTNEGMESPNLGDLIIYESIRDNLLSLFPDKEIVRISSHVSLERKHRALINDAYLSFIGGTNLLTYHIVLYKGMPIRSTKLVWLFPGVKNLIIFGAGWGYGYGLPISLRTRVFYKRFLHSGFIHSVRDQYSADKLSKDASINCINTSCPTTWNLKEKKNNRSRSNNHCLFTLTDYETNREADEKLLEIIFSYFDKASFFPQGLNDLAYLNSLPAFKKNKEKVHLLPHSYQEYKDYLSGNEITYVGTRLHGGIKCLQQDYDSMIISIDNRSFEMAKDINLPICSRSDYSVLTDWLEGKEVFDDPLTLSKESIQTWKNQFV